MLLLPEAHRHFTDFPPPDSRGSADLVFFKDRSYFGLLIFPLWELTAEEREQFIRDVLEHLWRGLVGFGLASGELPEIVDGDPHKMLPA